MDEHSRSRRLERGATVLLALGALAALAGAFLPWDFVYRTMMQEGDTVRTGIETGWGLLTAVLALGVAVRHRDRDWVRTATPAIAGGLGIVLVAVVAGQAVGGTGAEGTGFTLTYLGGLLIAVAGGVGRSATKHSGQPEPRIVGVRIPRRFLGAVAAGGALLVVGFLIGDAFVNDNLRHYDTVSWVAFAWLALVALSAGLLAWSPSVALAASAMGYIGITTVVASLQTPPPSWARGPAGDPAWVVALLLAGSLLLLAAGAVELVAAGRRSGPTAGAASETSRL